LQGRGVGREPGAESVGFTLSAIKNKKTMLKRKEKRKKNTECDNMGSNVVLIFFAWKPLTDVQVDKDAKVKQKREKT
jgi:hypothetical protein